MLLESQVTLKTIEKIGAKMHFKKKKKKASICMVTGAMGSESPISTIYIYFLMIIGLAYLRCTVNKTLLSLSTVQPS